MMTKGIRFAEGFKGDAVSQVTELGYSVKEVFSLLGISAKSLYDWIK
jgi:transposase